jgi:hypothetical protein
MKGAIEPGDLVEHRNTRERGPVAETCDDHCRLLVKASRLAEQWPTEVGDLTTEQRESGRAFRLFAAKLADAVTRVINSGKGWRIGFGPGACCCPLGAVRLCKFGVPPYGNRFLPTHPVTGQTENERQFRFGFDEAGGDGPYFELGAAYRRRFVRAESESA